MSVALCTTAQVLATYGHIRDLVAREESVQPEEDFAMAWAVDEAPRIQGVLDNIQTVFVAYPKTGGRRPCH